MGIEDLFALCRKLAPSQGFYGRLLAQLEEMHEYDLDLIDQDMKEANLKDEIDIITWLEG
ncbi:MAG: hypothetical protein IKL08_05455 [Clostridia bacterium]|nr:hypothetical protein [Clostridia bacterium]